MLEEKCHKFFGNVDLTLSKKVVTKTFVLVKRPPADF